MASGWVFRSIVRRVLPRQRGRLENKLTLDWREDGKWWHRRCACGSEQDLYHDMNSHKEKINE